MQGKAKHQPCTPFSLASDLRVTFPDGSSSEVQVSTSDECGVVNEDGGWSQ